MKSSEMSFLHIDSWRMLAPDLGKVPNFVPCRLWFLVLNSSFFWIVPFRLGFCSSCKYWLNQIIFLTKILIMEKEWRHILELQQGFLQEGKFECLPRGNSCQVMCSRGLETHHVKELISPKAFFKITTQMHIYIMTCSLLCKAHSQAFFELLIHKKFELRMFVVLVNKFWQCVTQNQRKKWHIPFSLTLSMWVVHK
jgi:hypothetical protein